MTVEEALAASVVEPVNDIFEIDPETRVITVPASEKLFGVANDGNSERKHFRCPKIVGDNIDLSTMHLYINYQNDAIKMSAPNVINLSSVGTSTIESITFKNSSWQSNFTTDTYIKIYGR